MTATVVLLLLILLLLTRGGGYFRYIGCQAIQGQSASFEIKKYIFSGLKVVFWGDVKLFRFKSQIWRKKIGCETIYRKMIECKSS